MVGAATTLVPSPVVATTVADPTKPIDDATAAPTSTSPAAPVTSTTPAVAATTTVAGSVAGSGKPGATPGSATGSGKPVANGGAVVANGSIQHGSVQRQANGSARGSVQRSTGGPMPTIAASPLAKVASVQGSAQKQGSGQQHHLQGSQQGPMLAPVMAPMLPEPMLPSAQPVDTKQEIVENYLNSLPQNLPTSGTTANRMGHFMNNRFLFSPWISSLDSIFQDA